MDKGAGGGEKMRRTGVLTLLRVGRLGVPLWHRTPAFTTPRAEETYMEQQWGGRSWKGQVVRGRAHMPCLQILSISHVRLPKFCPQLDVGVGGGDMDTDAMRILELPEKNRTRCSIQISDQQQPAFSMVLFQILHGIDTYTKKHLSETQISLCILHFHLLNLATLTYICIYMYTYVYTCTCFNLCV